MGKTQAFSDEIYYHEFTVPRNAVDRNGHVNNVVYVQWMQDTAALHSEVSGGTRAARKAGAIWVVRSHKIEYYKPAFAGEDLIALTWVVNFRRATSLRRYKFLRKSDEVILAEGETEWVFVNANTGRPRKVPDEVVRCFAPVELGE